MNKRIQELAEQATNQVTKPDGHYIVQEWQRVFAELIVNKCANIVWDEAEKTSNSDVNDAGYKIIDHFFGVEE